LCGEIIIQIDDTGKRWVTQDGATIVIPKTSLDKFMLEMSGKRIVSHAKSFELFWDMYPKKSGRKPCAAKWERIISKDESLVETIMTALAAHKTNEQWCKDGGMYVPMPSTWLNQERWNDVLDVAIENNTKPMTKSEW